MHRPPSARELTARARARAADKTASREHHETLRAIETLSRRFEIPPCGDSPVFLLASGWRSGSTLLQRLVMDSGEVFVWGEPYARSDHVRRMAATLRPVGEAWPRRDDLYSVDRHGNGVEGQWIANLTPTTGTLVTAHRAFFRTLLQAPREGLGWGMKEVRLGTAQAEYLRLLFPAARFVFLIRNPYAQWRSYRHWGRWHDRWPREVTSPEEFGAMWARLAAGFVGDAERIGSHVVRYEDLLTDADALRRLSDHLSIPLPGRALRTRVTGSRPLRTARLREQDLWRMRRYVEPLAESLGYSAHPSMADGLDAT